MSAARVGSGLVDVFATPMMVALIEQTCYESVLPQLDEGQGTVGTLVNVSHVSATPIGMRVWCDSELVDVDRRRLVFSVKATTRRDSSAKAHTSASSSTRPNSWKNLRPRQKADASRLFYFAT